MKLRQTQFILNGKRPEACGDLMRWAMWMEENHTKRHVAKTDVEDCWVSTVFLGLDHNFGMNGPPLLFETMAFGPEVTEYNSFFKRDMTYRPEVCSMRRYATWEQAEAGHKKIVEEVERYVADTHKSAREALEAIAAKS